jgi:enoyl-CoA hydratase/carnithine racemase
MQTVLLQERVGAIAILTLNRPDSLNSVNTELRAALVHDLRQINADASIAAVIITGAGERAFCSGQDLSEIAGFDESNLEAWLTAQHAMYQAVRDLDKPAVAAFNGVAAGAGFQLGLCCDLRVGYAEIKIGQPEIRAGLASIVGSYLMTLHVGLGHNVQLSLSGELIDGARAHAIGLLQYLAPRNQVLNMARAIAEEMIKLGPTATRLTKRRFRELTQPGFDAALVAAKLAQREAYRSGEPQAAVERFLARRGPHNRT